MQSRFRPLLPLEHGAWAMFLTPLLIGSVVTGNFNRAMFLLALTALGFFLLRFPLILAIKTRAAEQRAYAQSWGVSYAVLTAAFGTMLLLSAHLWALVPLGALGGITLGFYLILAARRAEMSILGEWVGIAGLGLGAPAAYLVGAGTLDANAVALYALNVLYFGGTVLYVKFKVREQPRIAPTNWVGKLRAGRISIAYHVWTAAMIAWAVSLGWIPPLVLLVFILSMCKVIVGVLTKPARFIIRRIGFIELGFTLVFGLIVILAYR